MIADRAAIFAAKRHTGHTRNDGVTPYFLHLERVAALVGLFALPEEDAPFVRAVAFLHDTIEDTRTDWEDLSRKLGPEVADAVAALSKDTRLREGPREQQFYATIARSGWKVIAVKLADVTDNYLDRPASKRKGLAKVEKVLAMARKEPLLAVAVAHVESLLEQG